MGAHCWCRDGKVQVKFASSKGEVIVDGTVISPGEQETTAPLCDFTPAETSSFFRYTFVQLIANTKPWSSLGCISRSHTLSALVCAVQI